MPRPARRLEALTRHGDQHGERSRIYIARAVLQDPDVLILDESFAAPDPELFRSSVHYLLQRDSALVLIAHP